MIPSRKQDPKGARRKKSPDYDLLVESISSLADSMMAIYRQSYDVLLPIVDDICQRNESVTQNELEHCFDYLLNISCTDFGKKLFDRVCVTFKSKYPDSVEFYVKENEPLINDAKETVRETLDDCRYEGISDWSVIKTAIKDDLSKMIYDKTRRSPMILPVIMEI